MPFSHKLVIVAGIGCALAFATVAFYTIAINFPGSGTLLQPNGKLLGGDFITFYNAGLMARNDMHRLYDFTFQEQHLRQWLADEGRYLDGKLPFVYPPLIAVIFGCLSLLPYKAAYCVWFASGILATLATMFALARQNYDRKRAALITIFAAFGYIPFTLNTLASGQLSWIGVFIFGWTYLLWTRHPMWAGLVFSLSYYKPPLFVLALLMLFIRSNVGFRLGFLFGGAILSLASWSLIGVEGLAKYLAVVSNYTYGSRLIADVTLPTAQGAGIYALVYSICPSPFLSKASLLVLILCACATAMAMNNRGKDSFSIFYCFVLSSSLALSLQCIRYDLSLLLVALIIAVPILLRADRWICIASVLFLCAFYFEWLFRKLEFGPYIFNLSSFLFIPLLILLGSAGLMKIRVKSES